MFKYLDGLLEPIVVQANELEHRVYGVTVFHAATRTWILPTLSLHVFGTLYPFLHVPHQCLHSSRDLWGVITSNSSHHISSTFRVVPKPHL